MLWCAGWSCQVPGATADTLQACRYCAFWARWRPIASSLGIAEWVRAPSIASCGPDLRVPPHRRSNSEGRPTVEDIAAQIRAEREESGPGILAMERKDTADVIGYCGLTSCGKRLA